MNNVYFRWKKDFNNINQIFLKNFGNPLSDYLSDFSAEDLS